MEQDKKKNNANREYKNSVFVDLFSRDENTRDEAVIPFYNALHKDKITCKEDIKFIYLDNVLFRKVRNDVSFLVNDKLVILLEHQSTINPNMPIRFLDYVSGLYQIEIEPIKKLSQRKLSIAEPEFYVIYNGKASYPAIKELRISDLFKTRNKRKVQLELIVTVININHSNNQEFLKSCPMLNGYKKFTEKVEKYKVLYGEVGYSMAIEECIKENIEISEYLRRKIQEVVEMLTGEYSYALELEASRADGMNEGIKKGIRKGRMEGRMEGREEGLLTTATRMKNNSFDVATIMKITGLSREAIEKL